MQTLITKFVVDSIRGKRMDEGVRREGWDGRGGLM